MRRAKVVITAELIAKTLCTGNICKSRVTRGLPADARVVGTMFDGSALHICFESAQFRDIQEGYPFPLVDVWTERVE